MKIVIAGAGAVGYHLAKMLASEAQDIFLIDENEERLAYVQSHLDIFGICGNANSVTVLKDAKIESCDLFLAVTSSEETNLLSSILAKKFGAKTTIARISNLEYLDDEPRLLLKSLGVDIAISPEVLAAEEIGRLMNQAAFTDNFAFEDGKLTVFGIPISEGCQLSDKSVRESANLNPNRDFKPIAIHRNEETIIITGNTVIKPNDIVYFISVPESIEHIIELCGQKSGPIKDVMILGGSTIGILTARALEAKYNVTIVEKDKNKCLKIADKLKKTLVIHNDGRDVEALEEEGLDQMDAFISLTADSETNIISSLVAKNHGVRKTIARVENIDYIHLSQNVGIDTLINNKIIAASNIIRYVRKGRVDAIASLHGINAEIIEFHVKPKCKAAKSKIRDLKFPATANIAGVIRKDAGFIPFGDFQLEPGDKVVVFSDTETIHKVETYFQ